MNKHKKSDDTELIISEATSDGEQLIIKKLKNLNEIGVSVNVPLTDLQVRTQAIIDILVITKQLSRKYLDKTINELWLKTLEDIEKEVVENMEAQFGADWRDILKAKVKNTKDQQVGSGIPRLWTPEAEMRKKQNS